ncbi:DUF6538 domain-containing protein, partial [Azospirillum halopraeferens]|uniref:DUF6538 domain-containing protein n=1 Tax=Azospirillum halopraeferens TaxID=34010 RepID=UPI00048C9E80
MIGRTHVNRSLRTNSYPDAVRTARRVAFEIETEFEAIRRGVGHDSEDAVSDRAASPMPTTPTVMTAT